jgi:peptidoglycan/xylan/chitin deacetylase (PgdA/CDA1 family)
MASNSVVILCYHTFIGNPQNKFDFSLSQMSNHFKEMATCGYRFVSWQDILENKVRGERNILITIDDGHRTVLDLWPLLKSYSIKPILFIYPAIVNRMRSALTTSNLRFLQNEGATLGGHGWNHLYINQKLYESDPVAFKREIYYGKKKVSEIAMKEVDVFAYPFGVYSDVTIEHLARAGFKYAFTIDKGVQPLPVHEGRGPLLIQRYMVTYYSWPIILKMLREKAFEAMK